MTFLALIVRRMKEDYRERGNPLRLFTEGELPLENTSSIDKGE